MVTHYKKVPFKKEIQLKYSLKYLVILVIKLNSTFIKTKIWFIGPCKKLYFIN